MLQEAVSEIAKRRQISARGERSEPLVRGPRAWPALKRPRKRAHGQRVNPTLYYPFRMSHVIRNIPGVRFAHPWLSSVVALRQAILDVYVLPLQHSTNDECGLFVMREAFRINALLIGTL